MSGYVLLSYSALTGTVYVRKRNGHKEAVPEAQVAAVISGYLHDHHLRVQRDDGTWVQYVEEPLAEQGEEA